jgi:hypothetical protein
MAGTPSPPPGQPYYLFLGSKPEGCEDCYVPLLITAEPLEQTAKAKSPETGVLIITYERDSIWNSEGVVSFAPGDIESAPRILHLRGRKYRYQEIPAAEVLKLLENPLGTIPISRIALPKMGPPGPTLEELIAAFRDPQTSEARDDEGTASTNPIIDVSSARPSDYQGMAALVNRMNRTGCGADPVHSQKPMSVEALAGAKVKRILVEQIDDGYGRASLRPEQIQDTVKRAWAGSFQSRSCFIDWAEGARWSLQAKLEFEDGAAGLLVTDGIHVALRDHDGNPWFLRLLPAAQ